MPENEINPNEVVDESVVKELQSIRDTNRQEPAPAPQTPQTTTGLNYASFWARVAAFLIDSILLNIFVLRWVGYGSNYSWFSMWSGYSMLNRYSWNSRYLISFLMPWLITTVYFAGMHAWRGQTI